MTGSWRLTDRDMDDKNDLELRARFSHMTDSELFELYRSPGVTDHEREIMAEVSPFIRGALECDRAAGKRLEQIYRIHLSRS